tara:strand:- start:1632 stop:2774 length:1143 start_codon:yes stop_codon:yes gene_type:complete
MIIKIINNFNFLKYIFIIFIVLVICLFVKKYYYTESFENKLRYYRCDIKRMGKITNEIFEENNIIKDNENWNVYVPCGYNHIEKELLTIKNRNKNNTLYIFGINGCDSIVSKNKIWDSLVNCFGRNEAAKYMPESFVLHKASDMELFRKKFNSNNIYILKKNVQRKEGLKLTSNLKVILNSVLDNYRIVQVYLKNLYLVNKRKVNLRIYLLIVIGNGYKTFYISNIGKCIYTRKEYNDNNMDFESNITSYNLDMNVYKNNPRSFDELFYYLDKKSKNSSQILSNNIYKLMTNVSKCLSNNIYQSNNIKNNVCFQLFGADVIFDNNYNAYLLELNKGPDMIPRDDIDKTMKKQVQNDMFKLVGILPNNNSNVFHEIYKSSL